MSASGINPGWQRDYFTRHRICFCDPTRGEDCHLCDGTTAADEREVIRAIVRDLDAAAPERRAAG